MRFNGRNSLALTTLDNVLLDIAGKDIAISLGSFTLSCRSSSTIRSTHAHFLLHSPTLRSMHRAFPQVTQTTSCSSWSVAISFVENGSVKFFVSVGFFFRLACLVKLRHWVCAVHHCVLVCVLVQLVYVHVLLHTWDLFAPRVVEVTQMALFHL